MSKIQRSKVMSLFLTLALIAGFLAVGMTPVFRASAEDDDDAFLYLRCIDYYGNPIQGMKFTAISRVGSGEYPLTSDGTTTTGTIFESDGDGNVTFPIKFSELNLAGIIVIKLINNDDFSDVVFGMHPLGGYTSPIRNDGLQEVGPNNHWELRIASDVFFLYWGATDQGVPLYNGYDLFAVPGYKVDEVQFPDLSLNKTVDKVDGKPTAAIVPIVVGGQTVTYKFTITNKGFKEWPILLTDTLPINAEFEFDPTLNHPGWTQDTEGVLVYQSGTLKAAARDRVTGETIPSKVDIYLTLTLISAEEPGERSTNTAEINWLGENDALLHDEDDASIITATPPQEPGSVTGSAQLSIEKAISGISSTDITFTFDTVQVDESGNPIIEDAIAVDAVSTNGTINTDGQRVYISLEDLEEGTYYFKVTEEGKPDSVSDRWTYSGLSYIFEVTIETDTQGNAFSYITYPETYSDDAPPVFMNVFRAAGEYIPPPVTVVQPPLTVIDTPEVVDEEPVITSPPEVETIIPEEEVPFAEFPSEPELEIKDEDPPLAEMPQTGFASMTSLWFFGFCASLLAVGFVLRNVPRGAKVDRRRGKH